jgi:hypothetical protein
MLNRARPIFIVPLMAACILFFGQCTNSPLGGGGGGSETINAKIIIEDTTARLSRTIGSENTVEVYIVNDLYRPYERYGLADSVTLFSDSGAQWTAPSSGKFNFFLFSQQRGLGAFINEKKLERGIRDTVTCTMKKCRQLAGIIQKATAASPYLLYIQGSPFFCVSDSQRRFSLPTIPGGSYTVRTRSIDRSLFPATEEYAINSDILEDNVRLVLESK